MNPENTAVEIVRQLIIEYTLSSMLYQENDRNPLLVSGVLFDNLAERFASAGYRMVNPLVEFSIQNYITVQQLEALSEVVKVYSNSDHWTVDDLREAVVGAGVRTS